VKEQDAEQTYATQLRSLYDDLGRFDDAQAAVASVVARFPAVLSRRASMAVYHALSGRHDAAQRELHYFAADGYALLRPATRWLASASFLADVCVILDDAESARMLYERLRPYAEQWVNDGYVIACRGSTARYLGMLATVLGRWQDAEAHFEAALAQHEAMGARPWLARTQHDYAAMLVRRLRAEGTGGEPLASRAVTLVDAALALSSEMGMSRLSDQCVALKGSLPRPGASAAEAAPPAWTRERPAALAANPDRLTDREVEVLRLLAGGCTSREIADELVLSVRTVERHILNIYGKIGARGRADATSFALRHHLL
jgi:DNA-binding NarL/FixJ family response regulator